MIEATELKKKCYRGHLQCHCLHTKFHPNSPVGSEVIRGFSCTHLKSLNDRSFGMVEVTVLKMWLRGHLSWLHVPTKLNENPPVGSEVIREKD
jgi:hypothetical protein